MSQHLTVNLDLVPTAMGPVTDLYQLTMMAGYSAAGISNDRAVFEVFVRKLPHRRAYLVFAGLEQAVETLLHLRFSNEQIGDLKDWPQFAAIKPGWFDELHNFRFTGNVWSVPEGTIVFPNEPLLRVEAPLAQAQLAETILLASLSYPTLVASKAARMVTAAKGRGLFDFGARRGHGIQASFLAARAAALVGFAGTSQVEAARRLNIPAIGTMAHSWVQAFPSEVEAFQAFARCYPNSTLLVDTYDIDAGVRAAARIEPPIQAIRIDSGDLLIESVRARRILDELGRPLVKIVASGDLDEDAIKYLVEAEAPIDFFGVGTELITSGGAPALAMVYKLVELNGVGRIKKSAGKRTYPLAKQIIRHHDAEGLMRFDQVLAAQESRAEAGLLELVVQQGRLVQDHPDLAAIQRRFRTQFETLPAIYQGLDSSNPYQIRFSDLLQADAVRAGLISSPSDQGLPGH